MARPRTATRPRSGVPNPVTANTHNNTSSRAASRPYAPSRLHPGGKPCRTHRRHHRRLADGGPARHPASGLEHFSAHRRFASAEYFGLAHHAFCLAGGHADPAAVEAKRPLRLDSAVPVATRPHRGAVGRRGTGCHLCLFQRLGRARTTYLPDAVVCGRIAHARAGLAVVERSGGGRSSRVAAGSLGFAATGLLAQLCGSGCAVCHGRPRAGATPSQRQLRGQAATDRCRFFAHAVVRCAGAYAANAFAVRAGFRDRLCCQCHRCAVGDLAHHSAGITGHRVAGLVALGFLSATGADAAFAIFGYRALGQLPRSHCALVGRFGRLGGRLAAIAAPALGLALGCRFGSVARAAVASAAPAPRAFRSVGDRCGARQRRFGAYPHAQPAV